MRYFGRTLDPKHRLYSHVSEAKNGCDTYKCRWIQGLSNIPIMQIVYKERCTIDEAVQIEKTILRKLMRRFNLTNSWDNCVGAYKRGIPVHQYSIDGLYIKSFQNSNHAAIELGLYDANILRSCKLSGNKYGLRCGNYFWLFNKFNVYPFPLKKPPSSNMKPVNQYDLCGNFMVAHDSARDAERKTGIGYKMISRVCLGEREHTNGYKFKFK